MSEKLKNSPQFDAFFNPHAIKWGQGGETSLFLGERPALHDGIHISFKAGREAFHRQVENRWVADEFNHEDSRLQFLRCPDKISLPTLINLGYQWESDSRANRAMFGIYGPVVSNSQMWEGVCEIANMELMHSLTYAEIVRTCIPRPEDVFNLVMKSEKILSRSKVVAKVFSKASELVHLLELERTGKYPWVKVDRGELYDTLLLTVFAFYFFERVQFMSSFAATFAVVDAGWFQSIGTAVQKIMQDEYYIHAEFGLSIIKFEMATARGKDSFSRQKPLIAQMLAEIEEGERSFNAYLLSEGRTLPGTPLKALDEYTRLNAYVAADETGILPLLGWSAVKHHPLPYMNDWLKVDSFQRARQEMDDNSYLTNVIDNDVGENTILLPFNF